MLIELGLGQIARAAFARRIEAERKERNEA